MTDQRSVAAEDGPSPAPAGSKSADDAKSQADTKPHIRIFGPDMELAEVELSKRATSIGRSKNADITLPNRSVSRVHATVACEEGRYILADAGSTCGTTVNGQPAQYHVLQHGDTIEIATYVLEFRTERARAGADEAAERAKTLLRGEYRPLPSTVKLKYRTLDFSRQAAFGPGNTMKIGAGGLLLPAATPPSNGVSLELDLVTDERGAKRVLGELVGVIEEQGTQWMCVKLHPLSKRQLEVIVAGARPGDWIDVDLSGN
ncbi:MAG: FHA domain-containing protein [Phycisphaerales bacterium]|nr:MAG: FHA domain-containing protein [Phycisphaerales bacterium]